MTSPHPRQDARPDDPRRDHERGARSMTRPRGSFSGWMVATIWSRCAHCSQVIDAGDWQSLAEIPGQGRRWVHEHCARELDPTGKPRPAHDRGVAPVADPTLSRPADNGDTVRVLVLGSMSWPRDRAVEVRDAIAGVARGHSRVLLVHAGRVCPDTGRLAGVDAWAELTATRLGLQTVHVGEHPDRHDRASTQARHQGLVDAGADVVLAFPLTADPATGTPISDPVTADAVGRAEAAGLPVLTHIGPLEGRAQPSP